MVVPLDARLLPKLARDQVAELMCLPPGVRGFWTDEELLEDARLSSLPMLKKLHTIGWVVPGYIPIEGGGRRRAWVMREVIRAALAVELARAAQLAVQGAATLLHIAPTDWIEGAVTMETLIQIAGDARGGRASLPVAARICLINMSEAWLERASGEFELLSEGLVISGAHLKAPRYRESRRPVRSQAELAAQGAAVLMLNLSKVSIPVVGAVLQARRTLGLLR
jgi:hypothetical protein